MKHHPRLHMAMLSYLLTDLKNKIKLYSHDLCRFRVDSKNTKTINDRVVEENGRKKKQKKSCARARVYETLSN